MVEHTMDVSGWLRKQLEEAHPDLLRAMVKEFAEALMSADADIQDRPQAAPQGRSGRCGIGGVEGERVRRRR